MDEYEAIGDLETSDFISVHHKSPVMTIDEQMARIRSIFSHWFIKKPPSSRKSARFADGRGMLP